MVRSDWGRLLVDHPPLAEAVADRLPHVDDRDTRHLLGRVASVVRLADRHEVARRFVEDGDPRGREAGRGDLVEDDVRNFVKVRHRCQATRDVARSSNNGFRNLFTWWTCGRSCCSQSAVAPLRFDPVARPHTPRIRNNAISRPADVPVLETLCTWATPQNGDEIDQAMKSRVGGLQDLLGRALSRRQTTASSREQPRARRGAAAPKL